MKNQVSVRPLLCVVAPVFCAIVFAVGYCHAATRFEAEQPKAHQQNGSGAYATGGYRNLFAELAIHIAAIHARVMPHTGNSFTATRSLRPSSLLRPEREWAAGLHHRLGKS